MESGIPSQASPHIGDINKSSLERVWYGNFGDFFLFSAPLVDMFPAWLQKSSPGSGSGNLTSPLVERLQKTWMSPRIATILGPQRKSESIWLTQRLSVEITKCKYVIIWVQTPLVGSVDQTLLKYLPRHPAGITSTWKLLCERWMFLILRKTNNKKGKFQPNSSQLN